MLFLSANQTLVVCIYKTRQIRLNVQKKTLTEAYAYGIPFLAIILFIKNNRIQ